MPHQHGMLIAPFITLLALPLVLLTYNTNAASGVAFPLTLLVLFVSLGFTTVCLRRDAFFYLKKLFLLLNVVWPWGAYKLYALVNQNMMASYHRPVYTLDYTPNFWTKKNKYAQRMLLKDAIRKNALGKVAIEFPGPFLERPRWISSLMVLITAESVPLVFARNPKLTNKLNEAELKFFLNHPNPEIRRLGFYNAAPSQKVPVSR